MLSLNSFKSDDCTAKEAIKELRSLRYKNNPILNYPHLQRHVKAYRLIDFNLLDENSIILDLG